jgi:hypothetical protein
MTLTKVLQNFYRYSSLLGLMQIECNIFFIDSFDVTLQIHMFNISLLLNRAKTEKESKNEVKIYETLFDYEKRYCLNGCHKNLFWTSVNCDCTIRSKMPIQLL